MPIATLFGLQDIDNSGHGAIFIILPNEAHGLDKLESKMNEATIGQKIFNGNSETVNVILPEFMIEYHSDLVGTLRQVSFHLSEIKRPRFSIDQLFNLETRDRLIFADEFE